MCKVRNIASVSVKGSGRLLTGLYTYHSRQDTLLALASRYRPVSGTMCSGLRKGDDTGSLTWIIHTSTQGL